MRELRCPKHMRYSLNYDFDTEIDGLTSYRMPYSPETDEKTGR